jgi:hypothetical protein
VGVTDEARTFGMRVAQVLQTFDIKIAASQSGEQPMGAVDLLGTAHPDKHEPAAEYEQRVTRCFELAGYAVLGGTAPGSSRLVHGSWKGPHAKNRIPHAWVELPEPGGSTGLIWEPIRAMIYDADEFRAWANAWDERTYTVGQARILALSHRHYGPWHVSRYEPEVVYRCLEEGCKFNTIDLVNMGHHASVSGHLRWSKDGDES